MSLVHHGQNFFIFSGGITIYLVRYCFMYSYLEVVGLSSEIRKKQGGIGNERPTSGLLVSCCWGYLSKKVPHLDLSRLG